MNMTVPYGALRCKDGDLAVVIDDTSDCRQNLGRVVSADYVWREVQKQMDQSLIAMGAVVPLDVTRTLPQGPLKASKP